MPLVIGSNSDEASVALAFGIEPAALLRRLGAARVLVRPLHAPGLDDASLGREVVRDVLFTTFARRIAGLHASRAPTWRYVYSRVADAERAAGAFGVEHGGELVSVFGTGDRCGCLRRAWTDADRAASRALGDRWVAFASTGVPDAADPPRWPRDARTGPRLLLFGADGSTTVEDRFLERRLDAYQRALGLAGLFAPSERR